MPTSVLGSDTNPGGRTYNEDRVEVTHLATRSGKTLSLAVLADGVGGEARGERASQLAIDTFLSVMKNIDVAGIARRLPIERRGPCHIAFRVTL